MRYYVKFFLLIFLFFGVSCTSKTWKTCSICFAKCLGTVDFTFFGMKINEKTKILVKGKKNGNKRKTQKLSCSNLGRLKLLGMGRRKWK